MATVLTNTASITTVQGLAAAVEGIASLQAGPMKVKSIQEHVSELNQLLAKQS
jgi:carbamoyl-phosphate synthase large subunit